MKEVWFDRTLVASKSVLPLITIVEKEYIDEYGENSYRQNKQTIECFVVNIVYSYVHNEILNVSRDPSWYSKMVVNGKTVSSGIGYLSVMKMIELFETRNWIISVKGFKNLDTGSKANGYVAVTDMFISLIEEFVDLYFVGSRPIKSVMILTDKKEDKSLPINFIMTKEKRLMKSTVEQYNDYMSKQTVMDKDGNKLATSLNRIFNRGDARFLYGGRFYGSGNSYQSLPEAERAKITINGESVFELDFKSIHVAMWCAMNSIALSEGYDVYAMYDPFHYELDPDKVNYFANTFKKDYNPIRNIQKQFWLIMINCGKEGQTRRQNKHEALCAIKKALLEDEESPVHLRKFYGVESVNFNAIISHIENNFPYLKDLLYSDMGIRLMRKDSDIMEIILTTCINNEIPVLCVHDSVIVPQSKLGKVMEIMKSAYAQVCGTEDNCVITIK